MIIKYDSMDNIMNDYIDDRWNHNHGHINSNFY